jgi:type I site-specific restriction endonuclease
MLISLRLAGRYRTATRSTSLPGAVLPYASSRWRKASSSPNYLPFVDGKAVGALEAKKEGVPLIGLEGQATKYSEGLPEDLEAPIRLLPFVYLSTGVETRFTNLLDPEPRSSSRLQRSPPGDTRGARGGRTSRQVDERLGR